MVWPRWWVGELWRLRKGCWWLGVVVGDGVWLHWGAGFWAEGMVLGGVDLGMCVGLVGVFVVVGWGFGECWVLKFG